MARSASDVVSEVQQYDGQYHIIYVSGENGNIVSDNAATILKEVVFTVGVAGHLNLTAKTIITIAVFSVDSTIDSCNLELKARMSNYKQIDVPFIIDKLINSNYYINVLRT